MAVDFTVAIPTFNGEKRLPEVLERLRTQINTENFSWEIIVVNNNSTDNTEALIHSYQKNWPSAIPLRYCFELKQGAGFARKKAIEEAKSELIGFLDDDNLPAPNWVAAAILFAKEKPLVGAYGSRISAVLEGNPPENFQRIAPFLAITERGDRPLLYERTKKLLPPSAGLVLRKQAWVESVPTQILTGAISGNKLSSEDLEMLSYIQIKKWEIWYNPCMRVEHKIPQWRLERNYLIPFVRGIGFTRYITRTIGVKSWAVPIVTLAYMANDLRKIIFHLIKYGFKIKTDVVAACEMQLFLSSFISPIYLWKKGYLRMKKDK